MKIYTFNELLNGISGLITAAEQAELLHAYNDSMRLFWMDEEKGYKTYAEKYAGYLTRERLNLETCVINYDNIHIVSGCSVMAQLNKAKFINYQEIKQIDSNNAAICKEQGAKYGRSDTVKEAKKKDNYNLYVDEYNLYTTLFNKYVDLWNKIVNRGIFKGCRDDYLDRFTTQLGFIVEDRRKGTRANNYKTMLRTYEDAFNKLSKVNSELKDHNGYTKITA